MMGGGNVSSTLRLLEGSGDLKVAFDNNNGSGSNDKTSVTHRAVARRPWISA